MHAFTLYLHFSPKPFTLRQHREQENSFKTSVLSEEIALFRQTSALVDNLHIMFGVGEHGFENRNIRVRDNLKQNTPSQFLTEAGVQKGTKYSLSYSTSGTLNLVAVVEWPLHTGTFYP